MPGSVHILKVTEKNEFLFSDAEIKEMILSNKSQEILNQSLLNIEDNYLDLTLDVLSSDLNLTSKNQGNLITRISQKNFFLLTFQMKFLIKMM